YKVINFSIAFLLIFSNSLNVFGNSTISAGDNTSKIDASNIAIISSNESGEVVSKLSDSTSLYQISASEENNYTIGQYATIVVPNPERTVIPVYTSAKPLSDVIGNLPVGSIVVIKGIEGSFAKISFNDNVGYIETSYIQTTGTIEKEEPIVEPEKTEQQAPQAQTKYVKTTAETVLNLREAPTTTSKVLKQLPYNTYTTLLETQSGWYKVKTTDGQVGYVSSEFAVITDKIENTSSSGNVTAQTLIDFAKQHIGKPYVYGGTNLSTGTDCSGFTYSVFRHFGININRTSRDQYLNGTAVNKSDLIPGDLVFFNTGGNSVISHVGIYIGNNQYIHCTDSKNQCVIISSLTSDYSLRTYYGARRVLK
ncbi:MAG: C40 family peptidase, partial [Eubacteriales bacterium]|nr:C40 family peptidase [Eubacteriales bacterium]